MTTALESILGSGLIDDGTNIDVAPQAPDPPVSLEFWLSASGSDGTGTGAQISPWRSLARVVTETNKHVAIALCIVHLGGAGPFTAAQFNQRPFGGNGLLVIIGDDMVNLTSSLTLGVVNGGGQYLKINTSPGALDSYIGKTLEMTSGPLTGWRRMLRGHMSLTACDFATTANITLSGSQTVDGQASGSGKRALVKNQTTGSEDGIYVTSAGAWTRATDANNRAFLHDAKVIVTAGTVNAGTTWYQVAYSPLPGTDTVTWQAADVVLTPCFGMQDDSVTLPSVGNTCVIRGPVAEVVVSAAGLESYMFRGFCKGDEAPYQGVWLINFKVSGSSGFLSAFDCGIYMHGIEFAGNATLYWPSCKVSSGMSGAGVFATALGVTQQTKWAGWGTKSADVFPSEGKSELFGYFVIDNEFVTIASVYVSFFGGRLSTGLRVIDSEVLINNTLVLNKVECRGVSAKVRMSEDVSSIAGVKSVIHAAGNAIEVFEDATLHIRDGAAVGNGGTYGINVAVLGSGVGGNVSFNGNLTITGTTADVHLLKNDYAGSYFNDVGIGVVDDVVPYASNGRVRRTG